MRLSYNSIFFKVYCLIFAKKIGEDEYGNTYYAKKSYSPKNNFRERRFIIYNGIVEASKVPQRWNAWLHHVEEDPPENNVSKPSLSKKHSPNLTGTPFSYEYKLDESINKKRKKISIWKPDE